MKQENQLTRVNAFIESLSLPSTTDGIILIDLEMESYGAIDSLGTDWQNGGNCRNDAIGACSTNKGSCVNSSIGCSGSKNGKDCDNKYIVGSNCQQVCY